MRFHGVDDGSLVAWGRDLAMGEVFLSVSNQMIRVYLNMEGTDDLSGTWSNIGPMLMWETEAGSNTYYYRFIGE